MADSGEASSAVGALLHVTSADGREDWVRVESHSDPTMGHRLRSLVTGQISELRFLTFDPTVKAFKMPPPDDLIVSIDGVTEH